MGTCEELSRQQQQQQQQHDNTKSEHPSPASKNRPSWELILVHQSEHYTDSWGDIGRGMKPHDQQPQVRASGIA
jgi:hypothetical protein